MRIRNIPVCCLLFIFTFGMPVFLHADRGYSSAKMPESSEPEVTTQEAEILNRISAGIKKDQEIPEIIEFLKSRIKRDSSPALDFALGNLCFQSGELKKAESAYRAALKKMPAFSRARANLARVMLQQGEIDMALQELQSLLLAGAVKPSTMTLLGYTYLMKGEPIPAESAYRQALLYKPDDVNAYLGLAKSLLEQERYKESGKILEHVIEEFPLRGELWSLLANTRLALDQPMRAIAALESARRLEAASPEALATLGDLLINQGQPHAARKVYREAFAKEKPSIERLLRAIDAFLMVRDTMGAGAMLKRARALEKKGLLTADQRKKYHWQSAREAQINGKTRVALKAYQQLLEEDPLNTRILLAVGDIYHEEKEYERALLAYERAGRLGEMKITALIRQARVEVEQGKYQRAIEHLEEAQYLHPQPHVAKYLEQVRCLVR